MFITQNNDPLITLSHISRPSLDLYHCWCWTMKSFHKFAFNGFLKVNLGVWTSQLHPTFFTFHGEKFFLQENATWVCLLPCLSCDAIITSPYSHFRHFRCFVQSFHRSVVLAPCQTKPRSDLVLDVLLADKDEKHEEAAEQVEAVNHPEEDLKVVTVAAEPVRVVRVDDVVDRWEHPEDPQDQKEFGVEHLQRI